MAQNNFTNIRKVRNFSKRKLSQEDFRKYHTHEHHIDVMKTASMYAKMEGISMYDRYLLCTAALLHDTIIKDIDYSGRSDEEKSAVLALEILPRFGYTYNDTLRVAQLIKATEQNTQPQNILEKIMKDADVDNLGRNDFFEKAELIRQERNIDENVFYEGLVSFLENHEFYTESAQTLRNEGLNANRTKLKDRVYGSVKTNC